MKIPFIIYAQALGIYMVLTLFAVGEPVVYILSAWYALASSVAAMLVFSAVFLLLYGIRASVKVVTPILLVTVLAAVALAYKALLMVAMPNRDFFKIDGDIVFPIVAVASGWLAVGINLKRISEYFAPPILEELDMLLVNE